MTITVTVTVKAFGDEDITGRKHNIAAACECIGPVLRVDVQEQAEQLSLFDNRKERI